MRIFLSVLLALGLAGCMNHVERVETRVVRADPVVGAPLHGSLNLRAEVRSVAGATEVTTYASELCVVKRTIIVQRARVTEVTAGDGRYVGALALGLLSVLALLAEGGEGIAFAGLGSAAAIAFIPLAAEKTTREPISSSVSDLALPLKRCRERVLSGVRVAARSGGRTAEAQSDETGVARLDLPLRGSVTVFVDDLAVPAVVVVRD
jgi:hypothetical protein